MPLEIVEGYTGDIDMQLKADGAAVTTFTSSMGIELVLKDKDRTVLSTTGEVSLFSSSEGVVRWTPSAQDLRAARSPYTARFKVTAGGQVVFFPSGKADIWTIYPP